MFDLAVIGAGPAGITAAIYALRAGKSVAVFEGGFLGGILGTIEKIENYPAFKSVSGAFLAKRMVSQLMRYKPVLIKHFVSAVLGENGEYTLIAGADEYVARKIIYAGGKKRRSLRALEGFEGAGISYCAVCDGFFYKNKDVAVVGAGFAADEDAQYLKNICKSVITLAENDLARVLGNGKIESIVLKDGRAFRVDGLFVALPSANDDLLSSLLALGKDIIVAGDAAENSFKQIVWACASGARAATDIFK